jgi:hypothetical protein
MESVGPAGFFWWLAAVHAAIGLFALYRMTRRSALPRAEQGSCVAVAPRVSPVAGTLYAEVAEAGTQAQASASEAEAARAS